MSTDRWMGVGSADCGDDVAGAAREAVRDAVRGREAAVLLVHVLWTLDLAVVAAAVQAEAGDAVVLGTSAQTVYARGGQASADLVVTALGGPGVRARAAASAAADAYARGAEVAGVAVAQREDLAQDFPHTTLLLLPSGTTGDQQDVVRGAYELLGPAVPLVGGGSDGDLARNRSWQLLGEEVVENGLVGVALSTTRPLGIGAAHGYRRIGAGMVVTASTGSSVQELDGRRALDVYRDQLVAHGVEVPTDDDAVAWNALAATHPLGLARRRRDEARTVVAVDVLTGSLGFVSTVLQGSLVHVLDGDEASMVEGARTACAEAVEGLAGAAAAGVLVFSCIARRELLSLPGHLAEKAAAARASGVDEVLVAYSCGEIARVRGSAGCHNQTVVALAV